ncbi:TPA: ABC transporter permease [Candidatus Acetothermia bacterium]|nr:ABC transporter permease [Candidatus Acetothermia bacterium]
MKQRRILFLLPALMLLATFAFYPTVEAIRMSFWSWEGRQMLGFTGLSNYADLFARRDFFNPARFPTLGPPYGALIHSLIWMVIYLPMVAMLGLVFAVLLRDVRGSPVIKSMILIGMVVPMVVGGIVVRFMFDDPAGIINGLLRFMGLGDFTRTWTAFPNTALPALILGSVWFRVGFAMIIYSAGLELIPEELYEAARIDGASRWKTFRYITVPMVKPCTLIVVIMSTIEVFRMFDMVYVATFGGPGGSSMVLGLLLYLQAFFRLPPDIGVASAIATFLILMATAMAYFLVRRTE